MALNGVATGNIAILKIEGQTVGIGIVNDAGFQDDFGLQDIDGLGDPESVEFVPGKVSHNITIAKFFVDGRQLTALGYVPDGGNAYLTSGALEIIIANKITGKAMEHYKGCRAASHGRNYGKHAPVVENCTFRSTTKVPVG